MDLVLDYNEIEHVLDTLMLLGSKGTTGTQASFLESLTEIMKSARSLTERSQRKWALSPAFL